MMIENCILSQVVIRRLLSVNVWFESRAGPRGVCSGQSGMGTDFSPSAVIIPPLLLIHLVFYHQWNII